MHGIDSSRDPPSDRPYKAMPSVQTQGKGKIYCPYCELEHYLSQCETKA